MQALYAHLAKHPVVYVTRERERAEGLFTPSDGGTGEIAGYRIYSDPDKSTRELIQTLTPLPGESVLVFKPNRQVEETCRINNWPLLNPRAELAEKVEGKVSQVRWLGELASLLPEHWEGELSACTWALPFVLQWNWGHSGEGTRFIKDSAELGELIKKFPYRKVRVSKFIEGDTYTNNNVVTADGSVLVGSISYQITGDPTLTDNQFATVGNDWTRAREILTQKNLLDYRAITQKVGEKLAKGGWRGLFGLDVIIDKNTGKMYLIEINARQPASTTFESQLQAKQRSDRHVRTDLEGEGEVTTFEAHLSALLGLDLSGKHLIQITDGKRTINRKNTI